jgi:hypothetical protein
MFNGNHSKQMVKLICDCGNIVNTKKDHLHYRFICQKCNGEIIKISPPFPQQVLRGSIIAGAIGLIVYCATFFIKPWPNQNIESQIDRKGYNGTEAPYGENSTERQHNSDAKESSLNKLFTLDDVLQPNNSGLSSVFSRNEIISNDDMQTERTPSCVTIIDDSMMLTPSYITSLKEAFPTYGLTIHRSGYSSKTSALYMDGELLIKGDEFNAWKINRSNDFPYIPKEYNRLNLNELSAKETPTKGNVYIEKIIRHGKRGYYLIELSTLAQKNNPFQRPCFYIDAAEYPSIFLGSLVLDSQKNCIGFVGGFGELRWLYIGQQLQSFKDSLSAMVIGLQKERTAAEINEDKKKYPYGNFMRNGLPSNNRNVSNHRMMIFNEKIFILSLGTNEIKIFCTKTNQFTQSLQAPGRMVDASLDKENNQILIFCKDKPLVAAYEINTLALVHKSALSINPIRGTNIGKNRFVYIPEEGGQLRVSDFNPNTLEQTIGSAGLVDYLAYSPKQNALFVASYSFGNGVTKYDALPILPLKVASTLVGISPENINLGIRMSSDERLLLANNILWDTHFLDTPLATLPKGYNFVELIDPEGLAITNYGIYNLFERKLLSDNVSFRTGEFISSCYDIDNNRYYVHNNYTSKIDIFTFGL